MEGIVCDDCGEEIPEGEEIRMMDFNYEKTIKTLCQDCYFAELAKEFGEKETGDEKN